MGSCSSSRQTLDGRLCRALLGGPPSGDTIRDQRLVGMDGNVLHGDLLLASAPMLIKPFGKYSYGPSGLFGELEEFCHRFKTLL